MNEWQRKRKRKKREAEEKRRRGEKKEKKRRNSSSWQAQAVQRTPRDQSAVMTQGTDHTFFISLWLILPLFLLCHQFHVKKQAIWSSSTGRRYIIGAPDGSLIPSPASPSHGNRSFLNLYLTFTSWDGHSRSGRAVA